MKVNRMTAQATICGIWRRQPSFSSWTVCISLQGMEINVIFPNKRSRWVAFWVQPSSQIEVFPPIWNQNEMNWHSNGCFDLLL